MNDLATASLAWVRSPRYIDLTARQIALLGLLCESVRGMTVAELATLLKVSKPVVTRAHTALAALGWVDRVQSEDDRRVCFLCATDAGREIREAMRGVSRG